MKTTKYADRKLEIRIYNYDFVFETIIKAKFYMSILNLIEVIHDIAVAISHDIIVLIELIKIDIGCDLLENGASERIHALMLEVLGDKRGYVQVAVSRLGEVLLLNVNRRH